ncbi:MAG: energy transducer TonB [Lewinella sp.]|jgi:protein TonB|uniref:energy transducer TonB n=1 Tax=Lewinella sp. TaxID=2004506 RepID=UPI003D6B9219
MLNFNFSGTEVLLGTGMILLLLLSLGFLGRYLFRHRKQESRHGSRTKYSSVDVFRYQPIFLRLGLVCSLAFTFLAFNWTQFTAPDATIVGGFEMWEDEIDHAPPITTHPPPPPPPPPPPKFEAVINPAVDTVTFRSGDVRSNTPIAPSTISRPEPPKYIPPPPPIKDEGPDIVIIAEKMPVFGDCGALEDETSRRKCSDRALIQFIGQHVRYPAIAKENGVSGTAVIRFVVEKDGSLSQIEMVRDPGATLGAEAQRVVQLMADSAPKWSPGKQRGRPVRVQFNLPVRFKLE